MNNIIVTASNTKYFNSLLTLIASIHRDSYDLVDQIFVFDLGLDVQEQNRIKALSKVSLVNFSNDVNTSPSDYAFKCYAVHWGAEKAENILWLDAGVMALGPIDEMYDIIENNNIFLVEDKNHRNSRWTHEKCREIMKASDSELNDFQLSAGILGYKKNGKYQSFINDAYEFSKIKECISGSSENHRHDQSIYSILASRYDCPRQHIDKYGYYTDMRRDIHTARDAGAVIFVHRNGHWDFNGLK
jgi:lipopolysaccharide biosynthesis glycosyltransferase